jgi:HEAT repeat protein/DNA polymerase III delta prime subunit
MAQYHPTKDQQFVFISYAQADGRETANQLYQSLREYGIPVWRDKTNLNPYHDFSAHIEIAIKQASHILVLLSPSIVDDEDSFVRREILYAQGCGKPIIPLVLSGFPAGKVPTLVNHLTWIDFRDYQTGLESLLKRLQLPLNGIDLPFDPFRDHVEQLKTFVTEELQRTVFQRHILPLRVIDSPEAVIQSLPVAYQSSRPAWFSDKTTIREFKSLSQAFELYEGRVLLLGEPGSGKTTTLLAFATEIAEQRLSNPDLLLPVYAPIHTWDGKSKITDWLAYVTGLDSTLLQEQIEADRIILMLDGLDELPSGDFSDDATDSHTRDYRLEFMKVLGEIETTPTIITCRYRGYQEIIRKHNHRIPLKGAVTLKPLSNLQIEEYLNQQPDLWSALQTDQTLFDIARTPLILTLLIVAYLGAGEQAHELKNLSNSPSILRDQLFKIYVQKRYEFEQSWSHRSLSYSLEQIYNALGQVASTSLLWGGNENEMGVALFRHVLGDETDDFIDLALRLHLLRPVYEGVYRFIHLLLRDHFAFPYCLATLQHQDEAVRHGAALVLAKISDPRAVEPLMLSLRNGATGLRKLSALALGQIGDPRANPELIMALQDSDKWVRSESAIALGKVGDVTAVDALILALNDDSKHVRQNAATALGQIADPKSVEPLIALLADSDDWVTRQVVDAIVKFGNPAIDPLVAAMNNEDANIRQGAVVALDAIGGTRATEVLRSLLEDADPVVKSAAAWALGERGDAKANAMLVETFSESFDWMRDQAAAALNVPDDDPEAT